MGGIQCGFVGPQWFPVSREVPPSLQKLETLAVVLSCHLRSFPIHVALLEFNQIEKICRGSKLCLEYHEVCVVFVVLEAGTQAGTARSTCCTTAVKTPGYRLEPKSIKHQSCKNISTSPSEFIQTRSEHRGTVLLKRKVDSLALELHPQGWRIKDQGPRTKN